LEYVIADRNGVAGIIDTAESCDIICFACQQISDMPFAFISPLSSDDNV